VGLVVVEESEPGAAPGLTGPLEEFGVDVGAASPLDHPPPPHQLGHPVHSGQPAEQPDPPENRDDLERVVGVMRKAPRQPGGPAGLGVIGDESAGRITRGGQRLGEGGKGPVQGAVPGH
jgi:hypothetical protein